MDIFETKGINEIDGKPFVSHDCFLTAEERRDFLKILEGCGNAEELIKNIEMHMRLWKRYQLDCGGSRSRDLQRKRIKNRLKTLERANKYITEIASNSFRVIPLRKYSDLIEWVKNPDHPEGRIERETGRCAREIMWQTEEPLQNLIKNLRLAVERKYKRGDKGADKWEIAFQIAKSFQRLIGVPRKQAGPYPRLVRKAFEILNIKGDIDRRRAIESALNKLNLSS
jgi:hypothetical protein